MTNWSLSKAMVVRFYLTAVALFFSGLSCSRPEPRGRIFFLSDSGPNGLILSIDLSTKEIDTTYSGEKICVPPRKIEFQQEIDSINPLLLFGICAGAETKYLFFSPGTRSTIDLDIENLFSRGDTVFSGEWRAFVDSLGRANWVPREDCEPIIFSGANESSSTFLDINRTAELIAYSPSIKGENYIVVKSLPEGSIKTSIKIDGELRGFSISPEGFHIAYSKEKNGVFKIYIAYISDGSSKFLIDGSFPFWFSN